jgi:hypothetical protein
MYGPYAEAYLSAVRYAADRNGRGRDACLKRQQPPAAAERDRDPTPGVNPPHQPLHRLTLAGAAS